jgi:Na+/H+-dicarboxylate symporter
VSSSKRLTGYILLALLAGAVVGYVCHVAAGEHVSAIADSLSVITSVFLRLIKMIIAPLVFATLVTGIAHVRGGAALGRMGLRTILWFIAAGLLSILLGVGMAHLLQPGHGLNLTPPQAGPALPGAAAFDTAKFLTHLVPSSIFDALANNEILQIVVFSLFLGIALARLGQRVAMLVRALDAFVEVMLQITNYVMRAAPVAVFAAIAGVVALEGPAILATYGKFIASFYLALLVLWAMLSAAGYLVLGRGIIQLLRAIREPMLLAFATASSEAAYPKTLEQLERVGIPRQIGSFVLPLGYSFNLDGSMMYCAFALIFIAQVYGIELSFGEQISMMLLLMVTSKGMAGVPRASLVVIAASLAHFNLPEAGVLLILGIDQFLDMGRTATNVVGNAVATAVVAKWEGAELNATRPLPIDTGSA